MFCCKCQNDLVDCTCPDIKERLESLAGGPAWPAALQNLMARDAKRAREQDQHTPEDN